MPPTPDLIKHKLDQLGKSKDTTGEMREQHVWICSRLAAFSSAEVAFFLHFEVAPLAVYRNFLRYHYARAGGIVMEVLGVREVPGFWIRECGTMELVGLGLGGSATKGET